MGREVKNKNKALFIQRLIAFIIDIVLVAFIASLLTMPFTKVDGNEKLTKQATELQEKYLNKEISSKDYIEEYSIIYYKISRSNGLLSIVTIILNILYFIVYQFYREGQTIGKKLMKIRVVAEEGELTMNQLVIRSLIADFILVDIITFGFMLFTPKEIMGICAGMVQMIQYIIVFISVFMIMFNKDGRGLHDLFAKTKVIRD